MDKDPVIFKTLTMEERESIPKQILKKIHIEFKNNYNVYQSTIESTRRKLQESENALNDSKSTIRNYEKKIKEEQIEKHLVSVENSVLKSKVGSLEKEVEFYKKMVNKNEPKRDLENIKKEYENKKKEIDDLLGSLIQTDDVYQRVAEYERANRLLSNKVNDLKKQLAYLLDSSTSSGGDESTHQKQSLIKIIQNLSKENERLNEIRSREFDVNSLLSSLEEKDRVIKQLKEQLDSCNTHNSEKENVDLFAEYQRVCEEKSGIYEQFMNIYTTKVMTESKLKDLEDELYKKRIEINSFRESLDSYRNLEEKYNEVNNELIKSNVVVREYRLRIVDLTRKLEESEERYSKYILSNRTDIVAILGRELGYIRNKVLQFADEFENVSESYNLFITEQDKLTEMYKARTLELEDCRNELSRLESRQIIMEDITESIPTEMMKALEDLYDTLKGAFQDVYTLFDFTERTTEEFKEAIFLFNNDLMNKDSIIKSLIDNNIDTYESLVKKENSMLKNEIVLLNAKIDNLQSEEYSEVIEKLDQIRSENENLREYISNLNTEIVNKDHTIRNLENNIQQVKEKLGNRINLIEKYEKIVEKLRKIKDEYVKLKKIQKKSINETVINLDPPEKIEEEPFYKVNLKTGRPMLSTETFDIQSEVSEAKGTDEKKKNSKHPIRKN